MLRALVFTILSLLSFCLAADNSSTLIDPIARYSDMRLNLPTGAAAEFPVLQSSLDQRPDCGETSYKGAGRLQGLNALITGGDSGIGRAIVIAYLREGANVAINYMEEEESDAQDLADFLAKEGLSFERIPGNLLNETFCTWLVQEAHRRLGGLDILVNHAGVSGYTQGPNWRPIANESTEQFDQVFRTNVYASFFLTRAAVPLLPRGGNVVFTASTVAIEPNAGALAYGASKAAIVMMVRNLAQQLAEDGIRVNGVAPGFTYTPFLAAGGFTTESVKEISEGTFFKRPAQPAELAPLYVSVVDAPSSYVSGEIYGNSGATPGF
ncbi:oxidoreductase [Trichoderma sp. SZMC 28011]